MRPGPRAFTLLAILAVVGAAAVTTIGAATLGDAPPADSLKLGFTLVFTGWVGLVAAFGVRHWARPLGFGAQMVCFVALALSVFVVNVLIAAVLMFISTHDLRLLMLLSGYAAVATAIPALLMGTDLGRRLAAVEDAATRLSEGDLAARVPVSGRDDIARLAIAFNGMAGALQAAHSRRDALENSRRELFGSISHDLRTPLSSMRVMVEAMVDGLIEDEATKSRYLDNISADIGRLSALIDDLFELARIDGGALELRLEEVMMDEVVSAAIDAMRPGAELAGVAVSFEPGANLSRITADPQRLTRVLGNLLHNAIRHTPPDGSVVVTTQPLGGEVLVAITDSGEGIPAADVPHVFERFYRAEKSRSREAGGSGLGLSISMGIVEAHGGRMWVDATGDTGTVIKFALPGRT
ncbi:MAG: HAMP domain-containing sensor histidine kinase [bacterium]